MTAARATRSVTFEGTSSHCRNADKPTGAQAWREWFARFVPGRRQTSVPPQKPRVVGSVGPLGPGYRGRVDLFARVQFKGTPNVGAEDSNGLSTRLVKYTPPPMHSLPYPHSHVAYHPPPRAVNTDGPLDHPKLAPGDEKRRHVPTRRGHCPPVERTGRRRATSGSSYGGRSSNGREEQGRGRVICKGGVWRCGGERGGRSNQYLQLQYSPGCFVSFD